MKLQILMLSVVLWLCSSGCGESSMTSITPEEINGLLSQVNEDDPEFVAKGIQFDSIVTKAGIRSIAETNERVKIKFFYFEDRVRGYFNLADSDDKNLQFFGRKVDDLWVLKCVTKINMEEVGGYLIFKKDGSGIWSKGDLNFKPHMVVKT